MRWHEAKAQKEAKETRSELARKKRVAGNIAREATKFWKQMLQVVDYKQKLELEVVKKEALEKHLDFIVGQTERFTNDLKHNMANVADAKQVNASAEPNKTELAAAEATAQEEAQLKAEETASDAVAKAQAIEPGPSEQSTPADATATTSSSMEVRAAYPLSSRGEACSCFRKHSRGPSASHLACALGGIG